MKEIKFRGKRLDNGEWIEGDLLRMNGHWIIFPDPAPGGIDKYEVDPATVGEFTGLKDKNGKEIYEGDVMEIPETEFNAEIIGRVLFEEDAYYIIPLRGGHLWGLHWSLRKHDAKIIGNIHDNPELLKGGEQ
ncbi:YopX family protein [Alistipes putredinis]|uniref:YopX family protein n=1 Tax=Alistipes putredinis TaxID=28117 RepID=UPI003FEE851E